MGTKSKHLYLPQLQLETANIAFPETSGLWKNNDHKIILGISDAIIVDDEAITRGISSIPDIWARPLMFQTALNPKSKHPLHQRITREWRGLLSLLALCKIKNYPVEIVPVKLGNDPFSHALKRLAPKPVRLQENQMYPWTDTYLIYYGKIVIGAFSPVTLVYTGADYSHKLKRESLMLRDPDGYLCPPHESYRDELRYVGKWLYNVQQWLNNDRDGKGAEMDASTMNPDRPVVEIINELISVWLEEIRGILGLGLEAEIEADAEMAGEPIMPVGGMSGLEKYRIYQALLYPLEAGDGAMSQEKSTDMGLDFSRIDCGYKEVVVVTEKLLREQGQIWTAKFLHDLGSDAAQCIEEFFSTPSGNDIAGTSLQAVNAIWVRPEKYFLSDVLLRGKQAYLLTENEAEFNCGQRRYIMPFTPEILRFFTPKDIVDRLKPVFKEENQMVRFSFSLPIVDRQGNKRTIQVEKNYRLRPAADIEGTILDIEVPVLEIFPRYLGPRWRRHYVFSSHAEDFTVTPVVHGDAEIASCVHDTKIDGVRSKVAITQIVGDDAFPEGLAIAGGGDGSAGKQMGLVLLKRESKRSDLEQKWRIGVDFGTSNTNVFKSVEDEELAAPWVFDFPLYTRRIFSSPEGMRQQLTFDFFLPQEKISLPIPTLLKIYNSEQKEHLLLDYFIYFAREYKLPEHTYSNIKWDVEERKTEYFIRALLFLLLIEVVAENAKTVEFACSYPKAFSDSDISILKAEWNSAIRDMLEDESRVMESSLSEQQKQGSTVQIESPYFEIEGVASGNYFADKKTIADAEDLARIADAAICLDVGGGTTDISVWFSNKIVSDASVLLAGQQISQLLRSSSSRIREYLFSDEAMANLEEKLGTEKQFASCLNLILRNEEKHIADRLVKYSNTRDVLWLRQMLALGFSALTYYTALLTAATDVHLRSRETDSEDSLLQRIEKSGVNLHWGGNAAKLINWINFGVYDRDSIVNKMLNAMFYNGLKEAETKAKNLAQRQSPGHKNEVAGGLVVMKQRQNGETPESGTDEYEKSGDAQPKDGRLTGVVSGEKIRLENKELSALEPLAMQELFEDNTTTYQESSLEQIVRFVECFNEFGVRYGLFKDDQKLRISEKDKDHIQHEIRKYFLDLANEDESKRKIEPVFILEVKALFELLRERMR